MIIRHLVLTLFCFQLTRSESKEANQSDDKLETNLNETSLNETELEEIVIIEDFDEDDAKSSQSLDELELDILTKKVELMKSRLFKLQNTKKEIDSRKQSSSDNVDLQD